MAMNFVWYFLILVSLFSCTSCVKDTICTDVSLELTRQDNNSNVLKLNGFYYGNPFLTSEGETKYNLHILYANGVVLSPGAASDGQLESKIELVAEEISTISKSKPKYGVFQIHGSEILLEKWHYGQCGHYVDYFEGQIVNDTVFTFNKRTSRTKSHETTEIINHTYTFREYYPKPDSLNSFIN
jgi:hypothetical protein